MSSTNNRLLRVLDIVEGTSVDGPGLRTSIYFAGCENCCEGCHNPQSWSPDGGRAMSIGEIMDIIDEADMNVTFSGGDPLFRPEGVIELARRIKSSGGKTLWCYTGYTFGQVAADERRRGILEYADVLVDGRYIAAERDETLRFRGSRNQRIIDVRRTLQEGRVVEMADDDM